MKTLAAEIKANFDVFSSSWPKGLQATMKSLAGQRSIFLESYTRLVSIQAWRSELLEAALDSDALGFFLEAQNDALASHVFAGLGSWRAALKALRSCIENVLFCLYYKDHPVELALWHAGKHRIGFRDLERYFRDHPSVDGMEIGRQCLDQMANEYSTLSKAVHASAKTFRMTAADTGVQLWIDDSARLGKWSTRQKSTIAAVNELLIVMFREQLGGTLHVNLRKSISLSMAEGRRKAIKSQLSIALPTR